MNDLIKREYAVKTVIRKCSPICAWQVGTQQYPDCVVAEINALPSAEAVHIETYRELYEKYVELKHASADAKWIPCSERLPKEKARVLTYDSMGGIVFGQYDKGRWYWEAEACADYWAKNDGVIAWMPLPTPYKGE